MEVCDDPYTNPVVSRRLCFLPVRRVLWRRSASAERDGGSLGAYAEYIAVSTHMLIHKPAELSWEEAAGIPEVCLFSFLLFPSPLKLLSGPLIQTPLEPPKQTPPPPSLILPSTGLDHSLPSSAPNRSIRARKQRPLARRRLRRLHSRHPTLTPSRRLRRLRDGRVSGENQLLHVDARRDGGLQLPHAGVGARDRDGDGRRGRRCHYRFRRRRLFRV